MEQQDFLEGPAHLLTPHIMRGFPKDLLGVLAKNRMQYREAQATVMCAAFRVFSLSK